MDWRTVIRWFLNPLVVGGALIVAMLLLGATLALVYFTRPGPSPVQQATAVLNVISAPTVTPIPPTATAVLTPTSSLPVPPPPVSGTISVGAYVQIANTGGDGLRLRIDPGLAGEVRVLGAEAEVFEVSDGPKEVDGFTWWYLEGLYDQTRRGWAVANYLAVVQKPE